VKLRQQLAHLLAQYAILEEKFHHIQPAVNGLQIEQRFIDPLAQQAFAHRRTGVVQHTQQGTFHLIFAQGFGKLQIAPSLRIQHHKVCKAVSRKA